MALRTTWQERLGNPLEWTASGKNLFILGILWLLFLAFVIWAITVMQLELAPAHILENHVRPNLPWLVLLLGLNTLLIGLVLWLRRFSVDAPWHEHMAAQWYALALVALAHLCGTLSLSTGVVLAGAPVVGFMFLRRGPVLISLVTAVSTHILITLAASRGLIAYGDLVGEARAADGTLNRFWVINMYLFTAPQFIVLSSLSWFILSRWRQREEEARLLSLTDALTGLPNRRSIMAQFHREAEQSRRSGTPMTLIMMDLDHFKKLNDKWGHPAGDAVLVATAEVLRESLRQSDLAGRYGGEEFMLLLHGADSQGASQLAERCREALAAMRVDNGGDEAMQVTASFGLCSNEKHLNMSTEELLERADAALYLAKANGRNRIEVASLV